MSRGSSKPAAAEVLSQANRQGSRTATRGLQRWPCVPLCACMCVRLSPPSPAGATACLCLPLSSAPARWWEAGSRHQCTSHALSVSSTVRVNLARLAVGACTGRLVSEAFPGSSDPVSPQLAFWVSDIILCAAPVQPPCCFVLEHSLLQVLLA